VLATLHRPSNVDEPATLLQILAALDELARDRAVLFPRHPRTQGRIEALRWTPCASRLRLLPPLPYIEMLGLTAGAGLVITDSGGVQEETSYLGVPCLTVRPNTERPITCTQGTNRLVPADREAIVAAAGERWGRYSPGPCGIERWDGRTAERIAAVVCDGERFA